MAKKYAFNTPYCKAELKNWLEVSMALDKVEFTKAKFSELVKKPNDLIRMEYDEDTDAWTLQYKEPFKDGFLHFKARFLDGGMSSDFTTVREAFKHFFLGSTWPKAFKWERVA